MELCIASYSVKVEALNDTEATDDEEEIDNLRTENALEAQEESTELSAVEKQLTNLLLEESDINQTNKVGWTALMLAVELQYQELIDALLKHSELNINAQDEERKTALMLAVNKLRPRVVGALLDKNAQVNLRNNENRTALIEGATSENNPDSRRGLTVLRLLLERGADINAQDKKGFTALMHAAIRGHIEVVRLLLAHNAAINMCDNNGQTARDLAVIHRHPDIVTLLENGSL